MSHSTPHDLNLPDRAASRRDGLSLATALIIYAEDSWAGVKLEYEAIIARHGQTYQDWTPKAQYLLWEDNRYYDQLQIALSDGQELTYFFDITDFYAPQC